MSPRRLGGRAFGSLGGWAVLRGCKVSWLKVFGLRLKV